MGFSPEVVEQAETVNPSPVPEDVVRDFFPLREGEFRIDIIPVGDICFRVNIWSSDNPNSIVADNKVARSYFVVCEDGEVTVRHGSE